MFGFGEIVIIFALALVVLGPKKLPGVAAQVGRWLGRARAMARQFREQLEAEVNNATDFENKRRNPPPPAYRPPPAAAGTPAEPVSPSPPGATDHRDLGATEHRDLGAGGDHRDLGASAPASPAEAAASPAPQPETEPVAFPSDPTHTPEPVAFPTDPTHAPEPQPLGEAAHPELEVYAPAGPQTRPPGAS